MSSSTSKEVAGYNEGEGDFVKKWILVLMMVGVCYGALVCCEWCVHEKNCHNEIKKIYGYYVAVYSKGTPGFLENKFFKTKREADVFIEAFTQTPEQQKNIEFMFMDIIWETE